MTTNKPPASPSPVVGGLLPCPFCGGPADVVPDRLEPTSPDHVYVVCKACDVGAPNGDLAGVDDSTRAGQIAAWNTRSPSPVSTARAALATACDRLDDWIRNASDEGTPEASPELVAARAEVAGWRTLIAAPVTHADTARAEDDARVMLVANATGDLLAAARAEGRAEGLREAAGLLAMFVDGQASSALVLKLIDHPPSSPSTSPGGTAGPGVPDYADAQSSTKLASMLLAEQGSPHVLATPVELEERIQAHARGLEVLSRAAPARQPAREIPAPENCPGCAKVARHPGEGYGCAWHPSAATPTLTSTAGVLLLPCPCGNAELGWCAMDGQPWHDFFIQCNWCGARTHKHATLETAVASWTRLVGATQQPDTGTLLGDMAEALRGCVEEYASCRMEYWWSNRNDEQLAEYRTLLTRYDALPVTQVRTAEDERRDVVADMRRRAEVVAHEDDELSDPGAHVICEAMSRALVVMANRIERGDHVGAASPKGKE